MLPIISGSCFWALQYDWMCTYNKNLAVYIAENWQTSWKYGLHFSAAGHAISQGDAVVSGRQPHTHLCPLEDLDNTLKTSSMLDDFSRGNTNVYF